MCATHESKVKPMKFKRLLILLAVWMVSSRAIAVDVTVDHVVLQYSLYSLEVRVVLGPVSYFSQNNFYYTVDFRPPNAFFYRLYNKYWFNTLYTREYLDTDIDFWRSYFGTLPSRWDPESDHYNVFNEYPEIDSSYLNNEVHIDVFDPGEHTPWYYSIYVITGMARVKVKCFVSNTAAPWTVDVELDNGTRQLPFTLSSEKHDDLIYVATKDVSAVLAVTSHPAGWILTEIHCSDQITADPDHHQVTFDESAGICKEVDFYYRVPGPEIEVRGRGIPLANGSTAPVDSNGTDLGAVPLGNTRSRTFWIHNTGEEPLSIPNTPRVTLSGPHASDFAITGQPVANIAPGGSTGLKIDFIPTAAGTRTATVTIVNNDNLGDETFTFDLQGIGAAPEMDVEGNGRAVVCGCVTPSDTNHTDFGTVETGTPQVHTFTVKNSGLEELRLSGAPRVAVSGDHAGDFAVTSWPDTAVASGDSTTFDVTFTPSAAGERTAALTIANDDDDENPYTFAIQGTGEAGLPVTLTAFSAESAAGGVRLQWITESETDNLGFLIERSVGAETWQRIASHHTHPALCGRGNTSQRTGYAFTDTDVDPGKSYAYRLSDVNTDGDVHVYDVIHITLPDAPEETALLPPLPNPCNPQTKIGYQLAESGHVQVTVYDLLGRQVKTLVNRQQSAGSYNIWWHGKDEQGRKTSTGTYLIVLKTQAGRKVQKAIMIN